MARTKSRTQYSFTKIRDGAIEMDQVAPLKTWAGRVIVGQAVHIWEVHQGCGPMLSAKGCECTVLAAKRAMVKWHRKLSEVAR